MYKLKEKIPIQIVRQESNFDRAITTAHQIALMKFDFDESGNCGVKGYKRSCHGLKLTFKGYQLMADMGGVSHIYNFTAVVK